jgi:excinuclease ABC subunit C
MQLEVEKKINHLPASLGVYLMKEARGKVIYVGKAKNLRSRVRSYFQRGGDGRLLVQHLLARVADVDVVLTDTEKEALILENNLIKQFKPRYNTIFRDDKTYVSIKIDLTKPFPHPQIVREVKKDGAVYFGPYSSSRAVRETLRFLYELYPIRKCSESVFRGRKRPCLYYQMGKCPGPCVGLAEDRAYREMMDEVILFLRGKREELLEALKEKMHKESEAERFEKAAELRDRIQAVQETIERQKISSPNFIDRDVFGYYKEGKEMSVQAMFIRNGSLEDIASYGLPVRYSTQEEVFSAFLNQFYSHNRFIPREILIPVEVEDAPLLEEILTERKGQRVSVISPKKGEKIRLVELAMRNAENAFRARHSTPQRQRKVLQGLKESLGLKNLPERIECFDISNIGGRLAVGSMVTFEGGLPNKNRYRRYKIETVPQVDDYAMMEEILTRRYKRALEEKDLPRLTVVDGGKGQLGVAIKVMEKLGISGVDVVALAKARTHAVIASEARRDRARPKHGGFSTLALSETPGGAIVQDRVFAPGRSKPILLDTDSPELLLLGRIRDEAHRFAITYHKKLRKRQFYRSPLDEIPGIGPARKARLMKCFGSIENIRQASLEDLKEVAGLPARQAEVIYDYFHPFKG